MSSSTSCSRRPNSPGTRAAAQFRLRCLLVFSVVVVACASGSSFASAKPAGSVMLHPRWRLVASGVSQVAASDRYAAFGSISGKGTLIAGSSGGRRELPASGCPYGLGVISFGGPWLMSTCGSSYGEGNGYKPPAYLYSLSRRKWVPVRSSGTESSCAPTDLADVTCTVVGVGARWIEFERSELYRTGQPCPPCSSSTTYILQSLQDPNTTMEDPAKPGGKIIADLNSPSGRQSLCRPLRVPPSGSGPAGPGRLTFYGRFAIASGVDRRGGRPYVTLERCGSRLHMSLPVEPTLPTLPAASSHAVIWQTADNELAGLFLPSLRRFTLRLPPASSGQSSPDVAVALSQRTLYVLQGGETSAGGRLSVTTIPSAPTNARQ